LVLLSLFALLNVVVSQDHHQRDPQEYIKRLDSTERAKQLQVPKVIETDCAGTTTEQAVHRVSGGK
jgi:hypothetical protein